MKIDDAKQPTWTVLKREIQTGLLEHGIYSASEHMHGLLVDISLRALQSAKAPYIATEAWFQQEQQHRQRLKAKDAASGSREQRQGRAYATRTNRVDTVSAPAWFAQEARRHKDSAGDSTGQYERAVL